MNRTSILALAPTICFTLASAGAWAHTEADSSDVALPEYRLAEPIRIVARKENLIGIARSAGQIRVGAEDFMTRPMVREAELLEALPGMIATQHSGDGKSNQMFLRGFNLDHGTDFRTEIEGMPVNLPTHGHGQGYTDLNFVIPEFVEYLDFRKGVQHPEIGDFGSAGGAAINLRSSVPGPFFVVEGGDRAFRYRRSVVGVSPEVGAGSLLLGAELKGYDGPWEKPQKLQKISGLVRYEVPRGEEDTFSFLFMGYDNRWESSDQIPRRAVESGQIGRFGQVDSTLGGSSYRYSGSARWQRTHAGRSHEVLVYGISYALDLFSNFTYFAADSVNGDQIEQVDRRFIAGVRYDYRRDTRAWGRTHEIAAGLDSRTDIIREVGLHGTRERVRVSTVREDAVVQSGLGAHAAVVSRWHPAFRSELGLRVDGLFYDVDAKTEARNSGSGSDALVSPKLSLAYEATEALEFYGNVGRGFHSNDVRGATIAIDPSSGDVVDPVDALVSSVGAELGVRFTIHPWWRSTVNVWGLELDSELVFVGDAGTTEASDGSQRAGIEFANWFQISDALSAELDVAFARARFVDVPSDAERIPGALENVLAAGLSWNPPRGAFGTLRVRHFGEYPLEESNTVRADPTTLLNLRLGWRFRDVSVFASALNLLDEEASDIQYFYESRLPGESGPVEGIHFHPVEPFQIRLGVSYGL